MAARRLSELVAWQSTPAPAWRQGLRWMPTVVATILDLLGPGGSISGPESRDPKVGLDRAVDLGGDVMVKGTGNGLPARYPSWQSVRVYADRATITPGLEEIDIDLCALTIIDAHRVGMPWTRRKAVDTVWQIHAAGDQADLTFRGSWLFLAHLGTLGNWPEPA